MPPRPVMNIESPNNLIAVVTGQQKALEMLTKVATDQARCLQTVMATVQMNGQELEQIKVLLGLSNKGTRNEA